MNTETFPRKLIFTDLDGTLLDHDTYRWDAAEPALALANELGIPVIPCSSKTLEECFAVKSEMNLRGPLVFENGAGVALPQRQFSPKPSTGAADVDGHWVCTLGDPYERVRQVLLTLRRTKHFQFRGFGDMNLEQIQECTGLSAEAAKLARLRRHGEPLLWLDNAKSFDQFALEIRKHGLHLTRGGRFIHVSSPCDKGMTMLWLARLYRARAKRRPMLIAIGDSKNDLPMLEKADAAVIIRPPNSAPLDYEGNSEQIVIRTDAIGPAGWNEAILKLLEGDTVHG